MIRRAALAAAVAVLIPLGLRAQVVESIEVRITNVDVVVTDKAGNPVAGLTKDDFELFENKRPQTITNFYEVRDESGAVAASAAERPAPEAGAAPPAEVRQRRIIFFIDNYSLKPFLRNRVFDSVKKGMARLMRPGDEGMLVVWSRGLHIPQPFTSDIGSLERALAQVADSTGGMNFFSDRDRVKSHVLSLLGNARFDRRGGGGDSVGQAKSIVRQYADEQQALERQLLSSLELTLSTLAGMEGKKVMVYVGAHLPEQVGYEMFVWLDEVLAQSIAGSMPSAYREASAHSMTLSIEGAAKKANADGVTMYLIDAADDSMGLMPTADSGDAQSSTEAFAGYTNTASALQTMAEITGGMALTSTHNFDLAVDNVVRDLGSYYSLGYRSAEEGARERAIAVKAKNPAYRVRSRRSFVSKTADEQLGDRVIANIYSTGTKSELPVQVRTGKAAKKSRDRWIVPVEIAFSPEKLTLLPDGNELAGGFSVFIAVGDEDGAMSNVTKRVQPVRIPAASLGAFRGKPVLYTVDLLVRKGVHTLSVAVSDTIANTTGFTRARVNAKE